MQETVRSTSTPSRSGIGQVARPVFHKTSGRVTELRAVDEGAVPTSAPATSRLFVLPVASHRWVSTDNTFWHARWDTSRQQCLELKIKNPLPSPSRTKSSLLNTRRSMMRLKLCSKL